MKTNVSFRDSQLTKNEMVIGAERYEEFDIVFLKQTENIYKTIKSKYDSVTVFATTQDIVDCIKGYQEIVSGIREINILVIG